MREKLLKNGAILFGQVGSFQSQQEFITSEKRKLTVSDGVLERTVRTVAAPVEYLDECVVDNAMLRGAYMNLPVLQAVKYLSRRRWSFRS